MKVFKFMVNYHRPREGAERKCYNCSMFRKPDSCTLVIGTIHGPDVCNRHVYKESKS